MSSSTHDQIASQRDASILHRVALLPLSMIEAGGVLRHFVEQCRTKLHADDSKQVFSVLVDGAAHTGSPEAVQRAKALRETARQESGRSFRRRMPNFRKRRW